MPENDPSPAAPLQFDTAEYATTQAAAAVCYGCKRPIAQTYYTLNAQVVCEQCRGEYGALREGGSRGRIERADRRSCAR